MASNITRVTLTPTDAYLYGTLSPMGNITGIMTVPEYQEVPEYEGEYVITPQVDNEVVLNTKYKMTKEDITVNPIPYFETSNLSGGNTVYIGGD